MKTTILLTAAAAALTVTAAAAEDTAPARPGLYPAMPAPMEAAHQQHMAQLQQLRARAAADMSRMQEAPAAPEFGAPPPTTAEVDRQIQERFAAAEARMNEVTETLEATREELSPVVPARVQAPRGSDHAERHAALRAQAEDRRQAAEARLEEVRSELDARLSERRAPRAL